MRNLDRCISAVLACALRNPDSSQQLSFKRALQCVCSLIDFTLMTQYRSHTPETLRYMELYLRTFHKTKDIFLEFRTTKAIRAQAERQDRELREGLPMGLELGSALDLPLNGVGYWAKLGLKGPINGQN